MELSSQQISILEDSAVRCSKPIGRNDVSGFALTLLTFAGFVSDEYSVHSKVVEELGQRLIAVRRGAEHVLLILCGLHLSQEGAATQYVQGCMQRERCPYGMLMCPPRTKFFSLDVSSEDAMPQTEAVFSNDGDYVRILHRMVAMARKYGAQGSAE